MYICNGNVDRTGIASDDVDDAGRCGVNSVDDGILVIPMIATASNGDGDGDDDGDDDGDGDGDYDDDDDDTGSDVNDVNNNKNYRRRDSPWKHGTDDSQLEVT